MLLHTTKNSYLKAVNNLLRDNPKFIYISSYGLRVDSPIMKYLMHESKCKDIRLVIGVRNRNHSLFLTSFFKKQKKIKIRVKNKYHTKFVLTDKGVIAGGRNFVDSDWKDLTFLMRNKNTLRQFKEYFLKQ